MMNLVKWKNQNRILRLLPLSQEKMLKPQVEKPISAAIQAKFDQGMALHQQGRLVEAGRLYEEVLQDAPRHFDALHLLGVVALQTRRTRRGVELIAKAIELNPNVAAAHSNLGTGLNDLKCHEQALASCDRAIALKPDYAEAYYNRGVVLNDLKRHEEALASYDRAIALMPDYAEAYNNRGNALTFLKRHEQALASCDKAIALKPDFPEAHYNRGDALNALKRFEQALASYDKAIALKPDFAEAYNARGTLLSVLKHHEQALASYDKAIALKPDFGAAHSNRGNVLSALKRYEQALRSYEKAIALNSDSEYLHSIRLHTKMIICDWGDFESEVAKLVENSERAEPFPILSVSNSPELQRHVAESWSHSHCPSNKSLPAIFKRSRGNKIHIGYFSADFRENHPLATVMAELFEQHDRSQFEVTAFSFRSNRKDAMTRRLEAAFDRFIDVRNLSDKEVALLARKLQVDIAVDLMGYTHDNRTNIFAMRAAPVQVNYLGYAGTMGAACIDYLIADPTLISERHQKYYTEKIAYLPNSYMPNDSKRLISDRAFDRTEFGLPQTGFVFCCFNNSYKLNPNIFDYWMRILKNVEGSVLWLSENNATAAANLRKEADNRSVNPDRLVFAKRLPLLADHLARHRLADLFLDTLPFNAHTTASDALWAGLPVLTQIGETFAGRVAASLLMAIGMPELITSTPQAYEDLAIELATNPEKLVALKHKLANNRRTAPLFDMKLFTKHIEAAYRAMYERYQADLPPDHIYAQR